MAPWSWTDLFGDEARAFADLGFRPRRCATACDRLGVNHQRGAQRHRARLVALHRHVGEAMTDHLIGGERPSELFSDFGVFQRLVEQDLHDADGLSPKRCHGTVDHGFDRGQHVAAIAEQGVGRELHAVEFEVAGPAAAKPRKVA